MHSFIHEYVLTLDSMFGRGHSSCSLRPKLVTLTIFPFGVEVTICFALRPGPKEQASIP